MRSGEALSYQYYADGYEAVGGNLVNGLEMERRNRAHRNWIAECLEAADFCVAQSIERDRLVALLRDHLRPSSNPLIQLACLTVVGFRGGLGLPRGFLLSSIARAYPAEAKLLRSVLKEHIAEIRDGQTP